MNFYIIYEESTFPLVVVVPLRSLLSIPSYLLLFLVAIIFFFFLSFAY